jgi:hypothetical protein
MNLLNDLTRLSNINANISKSTQTQIKFFIKTGRCLTPVKHETSAMHHNHHHGNIGLKDDYCTKELIYKSAQPGTLSQCPKTKPYETSKNNTIFKLLELNKSHPNYPTQPFSQYSNQNIRHQQINLHLQNHKHQLTKSLNQPNHPSYTNQDHPIFKPPNYHKSVIQTPNHPNYLEV